MQDAPHNLTWNCEHAILRVWCDISSPPSAHLVRIGTARDPGRPELSGASAMSLARGHGGKFTLVWVGRCGRGCWLRLAVLKKGMQMLVFRVH
jgi:hypothetical protein